MIWLGLAVYQTDINCRAYKNCRQSQIFFKKNVAKLLTTKGIYVHCEKGLHNITFFVMIIISMESKDRSE